MWNGFLRLVGLAKEIEQVKDDTITGKYLTRDLLQNITGEEIIKRIAIADVSLETNELTGSLNRHELLIRITKHNDDENTSLLVERQLYDYLTKKTDSLHFVRLVTYLTIDKQTLLTDFRPILTK
jgi:hypothetical protein